MNANAHNREDRMNELIAGITRTLLRSRTAPRLISGVALSMLSQWAGDSRMKQKIASPANWIFRKIGKEKEPGKTAAEPIIAGDVAQLLTLLLADGNAKRATGKPGQSPDRGKAIEAFLKNFDFGEMVEMAQGAEPYVIDAIRAFNEQLWKYPAKVGALTAASIPLLNTSLKAAREAMLPIEESFGPDLLADIMLSVLKGVSGEAAAKLVNTVYELMRRIYTGSLLLEKGSRSVIQIYLNSFFRDYLPALDPELVRKNLIIAAKCGEDKENALSEALTANPDIVLSVLASLGAVKSSKVRVKARKLRILEEIPAEGLHAAVAESASDLDTYEIAGLINAACRVLAKIHDAKPDVVSNLASGIVDSVNYDDVQRISRWLIPDLIGALKPLAPAILPELMAGLKELMNTDEGTAVYSAMD